MSETIGGIAVWFQEALGRMALLGALILALQVPIVGIYGLVGEREGNRLAAIAEVRESWGGSQLPQGPVLVVPYRSAETPWIDPYERSMGVAYAYLRPHELRIRATMSPIVRTRGIFDVLLYRAAFHFEATFARPDPEELGVEEASILWDAIRVALPSRPSVPDSVAIQDVNVLPARSHLERYVEAPLPTGRTGRTGRTRRPRPGRLQWPTISTSTEARASPSRQRRAPRMSSSIRPGRTRNSLVSVFQ